MAQVPQTPMGQVPQLPGGQGPRCSRCLGKGFIVKQTSSGDQRIVCGGCKGTGKGGYLTK